MALLRPLILFLLLLTAACSAPPPDTTQRADTDEIAALAASIRALGPDVDPEEALRTARIALAYPWELRAAYQVSDPPLVHNMKVNLGLRPRGLCYHWADDMEARLRQERLQTLRLHRAIANHDKSFRIEHSTVIVSHLGGTMNEGIVLDPWRYGGRLAWSKTLEDPDYDWVARQDVFADKRRWETGRARLAQAQ